MPVQPTVRGSFLWGVIFLVSFGKAFTRIASCGHDLLAGSGGLGEFNFVSFVPHQYLLSVTPF